MFTVTARRLSVQSEKARKAAAPSSVSVTRVLPYPRIGHAVVIAPLRQPAAQCLKSVGLTLAFIEIPGGRLGQQRDFLILSLCRRLTKGNGLRLDRVAGTDRERKGPFRAAIGIHFQVENGVPVPSSLALIAPPK